MKKTLIKLSVFIIIFFAALIIAGKVMNKGHENITMEMAQAAFPIVYMERNGERYNCLHGYSNSMDTAFQREVITVLGENRETGVVIDTYGRSIDKISMEVRSIDGERLIENSDITDYEQTGDEISADVELKDLIDKDTEYMLVLILSVDGSQIRYYSRVVWSDSLNADEKLAFVKDFHEKLYDKEAAKELTKYLETNSKLQDNKSFSYVNIHSSFKQITWGDLPVKEEAEPKIRITEISGQTASFLVDYIVSTSEEDDKQYYKVQEYYRIRYTQDRTYLLDYERTMTQFTDVDEMCANDKILLGITDEDVQLQESEDGNIVVFEAAGRLLSYNVTTNQLAVIFSFYDEDNADERTLYDQHTIKILDVDEGGNVQFAVYGYMNRGRHEGEVGIEIYSYDNTFNTIEEIIYIPYNKSYTVLDAELNRLLYLSREQKLYISLENNIYCVDLAERSYSILANVTQDGTIQVSDNHRIFVSLVTDESTDINHCSEMSIRNLNNETEVIVSVGMDEAIRPLGFMGEDVIYGVARSEEIVEESSGRIIFPMYKVCICDSDGKLLKEYEQEGIYITGCVVEENQITLTRSEKQGDTSYTAVEDDHIMDNSESETGKNVIYVAAIDIYERYVQIQTRNTIDTKTLKVLTPKEVVFEGGRSLEIESGEEPDRYYVYGPYGISGIYNSSATAVNLAYDISGVVTDNEGDTIWLKGTRATKNQIMAIKGDIADDDVSSLAVCLDTMLKYEGIIRNSEYLFEQGQTVMEILEDNLTDAKVLDLTGCSLDAVLYYVNQDIPVLAILNDGNAVLLTGFNEYNVVIMNPDETTPLYKKGINDTTEWLEENGNNFITYVR
ncbi:MAG: hypothetical protein LUG83_09915 [Lachnospiraceae bacterium]|nr:hypothetical protein [Lachnospiraceae bacterium]